MVVCIAAYLLYQDFMEGGDLGGGIGFVDLITDP